MSGREPPAVPSRADADYLLLLDRLVQRFSAHARALGRLDTLIRAQATELAELREQSRLQVEALARLEVRLARTLEAIDALRTAMALQHRAAPLRPWWARWWRW
jgi:hypothetical protein